MNLVIGSWYSVGRFGHYRQYCGTLDNGDGLFRYAGTSHVYVIDPNDLAMLEEVRLVPSFSCSNIGDLCFSVETGYECIKDLCEDSYGNGLIKTASGKYYYKDGRKDDDNDHPGLFESLEQFVEYWEEQCMLYRQKEKPIFESPKVNPVCQQK